MKSGRRHIQVWADWAELPGRQRMGDLVVQMTRGKEIFSFEYDGTWLKEGPTGECQHSCRMRFQTVACS